MSKIDPETFTPDYDRPPGAVPEAHLDAELLASGTWDEIEIEDLTWKAKIEAVQHLRTPPVFVPDPDTADYMLSGHAGAGPSAAERWMNCTASLGASKKFLETLDPNALEAVTRSSIAAREGTTAHAAGEAKLRHMLGEIEDSELDLTLMDLAVSPSDGEEYDEEMSDHLDEYVNFVASYITEGREVLVESRVEAAVPLLVRDAKILGTDVHYLPGSADVIVLPDAEHKTLVICDLKYGKGIDVDVSGNPQIRIYALGALSLLADDEGNLPEIDMIEYVIVQPRLGGIKVSTEPVESLLTWRDQNLAPVLGKALAGTEHGATFKPSAETCQWCPIRGQCSALTNHMMSQGEELFDIIIEGEHTGEGVQPDLMDNDRLGAVFSQIRDLVALHDAIKAEAQRRACSGQHVPGFKLVSYTPKRSWKPEAPEKLAKARSLWKEPDLMTPTQALDKIKRASKDKGEDPETLKKKLAKLEKLIDVPDKRPVIAPENDRRKTWQGREADEMFSEIKDGE